MNNFLKIFFTTLFIIHCSSDASSENILTYNLESDINEESNEGDNETTSGLSLQLMFSYDSQTSSYSTLFENYSRSLIIHTPPNFDYLSESLPLLFVLHGYTREQATIGNIPDLTRLLMKNDLLLCMFKELLIFMGILDGM